MFCLLKSFVSIAHKIISKSRIASVIYLNTIAILIRPFPINRLKELILSSLKWVQWPNTDLPFYSVIIGNNTHIKMFPHTNEEDMEILVSKKMNYEKEVFSFLEPRMSKYDAVIEIGANFGIYTLFFASKLKDKPQSKIICFEPSKVVYKELIKNLDINSFKDINAYNMAVDLNNDYLTFYTPQGHLKNGSLFKNFSQIFSDKVIEEKVLVISGSHINSLVSNYKNILIKIDAEGSECNILTSMTNLISEKKPDIIVEVLDFSVDNLNSLKFPNNVNYSFFNITDKGLIKYEKFIANQFFRDYFLTANKNN